MTELLQRAFAVARTLPDVDQDFIGWFVLDQIEKGRLQGEPAQPGPEATARTSERIETPRS